MFKQDVTVSQAIFWEHNLTSEVMRKLNNPRGKSGVWILEAHDMFDGYLHEYFSQRLIKDEEVHLFNAQATLYIPPSKFLASLKRSKIPLDWISLEGNILARDFESIKVEGDFQLSIPEFLFEQGKYELSIQMEGIGGQKFQISLPSEHSPQSIHLEENRKEYKIQFDCQAPQKGSIVIKTNLDKNSIQKNTIIQNIQIQRIETLGDFLGNLTDNMYDSKIILSVKEDAKQSLNAKSLQSLEKMGLKKIQELKYGESYLAVIDKGKIVYEERGSKYIKYKKGKITAMSAGLNFGNKSEVIIDKIDYSKNARGINIVIVKEKSIASYYSDTNADNENLLEK